MKAIFQGEFHTSSSDREALRSRLDEDADALFIEGRNDSIGPDEWTLGYLTFLVGALVLFSLQALLDTDSDIEEEADIPIYDEIDTSLPELYSTFPVLWRTGSGIFAAIIFFWGLFVPIFTIPQVTLPPVITYIYTAIGKPLLVIGAPLIFSFPLTFLEECCIGGRDEDMANGITEISKENGYQTVVVSCGQAHLGRLPALLEEEGWEVEINESKHGGFGTLWRWCVESDSC